MKRSSSVPEMTLGPSSSSPTASSSPCGAAGLKTRRGISSSQISLPGDLARPAILSSSHMDTSSSSSSSSSNWRPPTFSPIPLSRLNSPTSRPHRVEQLKKEECIDERQSEKEVMEINNLNQSYEELRVDPVDMMDIWPVHSSPSHQPSFLSPSSPLAKLGSAAARSRSLTPTSPLPNRTYCRRSCSPVLRPSQLWTGQKRKREESFTDVDMDTSPTHCPAKRFQPTSLARALSPTISTSPTPNTGNSPLYQSSRKSSCHSDSTPLSSPSSVIAGGSGSNPSANPFATNYDSGNTDHWSSSASSSGGQSPLLVTSSSNGRENGRNADEARRCMLYSHAVDMKNNLSIETTALIADQNLDAPSPLSPKGLQFRHRPFLTSSSSLQSPIPRSPNSIITSSSSRSPRLVSSSLVQHDLSPFISDPAPTHSHSHRQLHRVKHLPASSLTVPPPPPLLRPQPKPPEIEIAGKSNLLNRLPVHPPLSKLSVSTSVDDGGGGGGYGKVEHRKKRRNSDISFEMESDPCLIDEGIEISSSSTKPNT